MTETIGHPVDDVNATRDPSLRAAAHEGAGAGPRTPWQYGQEQRPDPDEQAALAVVKQRAEETSARLAQARLSNGDHVNAPHFLLNVAGREQCGQCGQQFPCPAYLAVNPASAPEAAGREYAAVSGDLVAAMRVIEQAASAVGVTPAHLIDSLNRPPES
jgi:hypothetical protein